MQGQQQIWKITGLVQGVGFRPTLWRTAVDLALTGYVYNDAQGVTALVEGPAERLALFADALKRRMQSEAPLARIDSLQCVFEGPAQGYSSFEITQSQGGDAHTMVTPDAATCRACALDMFDPTNRRWRYPFTNCTHCGPRLTITRGIPYDRRQTSMAPFVMCPQCQAEYDNPADRRFHAQPNACPVCGPQLQWTDATGAVVAVDDPLEAAVAALRAGKIVAIKGLGGFHLACDALNAQAVRTLRARKERDEKPFAVMFANVASIAPYAEIGAQARELLQSPAHPIVLAAKTALCDAAMPDVAEGLTELGVMLPYTPVHLALFHEAAGRPTGLDWLEHEVQPSAWVMTSANPSGEPLVIDNDEAIARLGSIADFFLMHNRDIVTRCDDSVVRLIDDAPRLVRRSRGYTPLAVRVAHDVTGIVATGAALKVTACVGRDNEAFLTEHIGETDNVASCTHLRQSVAHFLDILQVRPRLAVCDLHPDFFSTHLAHELSATHDCPVLAVQHHHAHTAAVAHEYALSGPYWGLALDGVGLGSDGSIWGAELLACPGDGTFERLAHLQSMALPGGDKAAREPWRMGASLAVLADCADTIEQIWPQWATMPIVPLIQNTRLTRRTTSMGRLFDGVSAIARLCTVQHDEARAAMLLESAAQQVRAPYPVLTQGWSIEAGTLSLTPLIAQLIDMAIAGAPAGEIAALFHGTLSAALADLVIEHVPAGSAVCLSGGTFLNRYLATDLPRRLREAGLKPYLPSALPPGDGAISFGQLAVAAERLHCGTLTL